MMINDAQVTLAGYVATDPIFKKLGSGASFTKLRIAYTERRRDRETGDWSDGPTTFLGVQCWRALAENVARSLRKGEPVLVRGRLFTRHFQTSEGQERSVLEVEASSIGHDLTRGVALFSRTRKAAGGTAMENAATENGAVENSAVENSAVGNGTVENASAENATEENAPAAEAAAGNAAVTAAVSIMEAARAGETAAPPAGGVPEPAETVIDETAVAEFARELGESLAAEPEPSPA
jgi:single-strand DNA-binding protein